MTKQNWQALRLLRIFKVDDEPMIAAGQARDLIPPCPHGPAEQASLDHDFVGREGQPRKPKPRPDEEIACGRGDHQADKT